jgi:choline/glycine/proline betaine transport protein
MAALGTFLLATWFITSSDSGTLVITTMLSMGSDDPPQRFRIVWGLGEGVVAAVLLLAGGLKALQTASIAAALPVSVIMLMMTYGIVKSLKEDSSAVQAGDALTAPDGTSLRRELNA